MVALLAVPPGMVRHAMAASAADTAAQDDRSDRIQDQEDAIDAARTPRRPDKLPVRPCLPLRANSISASTRHCTTTRTPGRCSSAGLRRLKPTPRSSWAGRRSLTTIPLKLNVKLRADTDRYANVPQADEDETSGSFKASYYDASNDQAWAPFFSYKAGAIFDPTFSPWTETKNDLALGFDKLFNFDGDFHLLPASARSRVAAVWSLGVSSFVQRRLRTPGPNSTALYVVPSATYVPSEDWSVSLFVNTRERWFDSGTSTTTTVSRRDFEIEPISTIAYDPKLPGAPQIALQIGFERRSSNLPNMSWNQWTVGPVLTANWRF